MIEYIKFEDSERIGNLELDFRNENKKPCNTIVFAGENGSGKTLILKTIKDFQEGSYLGEWSPLKEIKYLDKNENVHVILRDEEALYPRPEDGMSERDFDFERVELCIEKPYDIRAQKVLFSEARSGFEASLKRYEFQDRRVENIYEKEGANYSEIVRALIDMEEEDNREYIRYMKLNPQFEHTYEEYMRNNSRIERFKRAYSSIFEDLSYMGIDHKEDEDTVYFMRGKQRIDINDLSSGEQQIVFRGTDLLYHAENASTIIIDEPELSLHPKWQEKILSFYRNLFTNEDGKQIAQLMIATHSQYIIQSAMNKVNRDDVKIILLKKSDLGIEATTVDNVLLGSYSSAEINYLAFGVEKREYHIQLFGALHNTLCNMKGSNVNNKIASIDQYIKGRKEYNSEKHEREDASYNHYYTLPVFIRNAIDHPDSERIVEDADLDISISLLRNIYKHVIEENENTNVFKVSEIL